MLALGKYVPGKTVTVTDTQTQPATSCPVRNRNQNPNQNRSCSCSWKLKQLKYFHVCLAAQRGDRFAAGSLAAKTEAGNGYRVPSTIRLRARKSRCLYSVYMYVLKAFLPCTSPAQLVRFLSWYLNSVFSTQYAVIFCYLGSAQCRYLYSYTARAEFYFL